MKNDHQLLFATTVLGLIAGATWVWHRACLGRVKSHANRVKV